MKQKRSFDITKSTLKETKHGNSSTAQANLIKLWSHKNVNKSKIKFLLSLCECRKLTWLLLCNWPQCNAIDHKTRRLQLVLEIRDRSEIRNKIFNHSIIISQTHKFLCHLRSSINTSNLNFIQRQETYWTLLPLPFCFEWKIMWHGLPNNAGISRLRRIWFPKTLRAVESY